MLVLIEPRNLSMAQHRDPKTTPIQARMISARIAFSLLDDRTIIKEIIVYIVLCDNNMYPNPAFGLYLRNGLFYQNMCFFFKPQK